MQEVWDDPTTALPDAVRICMLQAVAETLGFAHEKGIIHRDLKPGQHHDWLRFGEVRCSAGLAAELRKQAMASGMPYSAGAGLARVRQTTCKGAAMGDVDGIGPGVDVYGCGAMLYRLPDWRTPHVGRNLLNISYHHQQAGGNRLPRKTPSASPGLIRWQKQPWLLRLKMLRP